MHMHTHRSDVTVAPGDDSIDVAAITDVVSIVSNLVYANVVDALLLMLMWIMMPSPLMLLLPLLVLLFLMLIMLV